jgi:hypothetical protein
MIVYVWCFILPENFLFVKNSRCLIENVTEKWSCLTLKMLPKLK